MKKCMLFFAGMLMVGVMATYAQSDTTGTQKSKQSQVNPQTQSQNYTKDMVKIQANQIPQNLRTTLSGTTYKGWESGTVYRTKASDGYLIEMKDGSKTKTYRFDGEGKAIPDNQ